MVGYAAVCKRELVQRIGEGENGDSNVKAALYEQDFGKFSMTMGKLERRSAGGLTPKDSLTGRGCG